MTFNQLSFLLAPGATGGGLNYARLWYNVLTESDSAANAARMAPWRFKSVDFITNDGNVAVAATPQKIDLTGLQGSVNSVYFYNRSTTNVTNKNYLLTVPINQIDTVADGNLLTHDQTQPNVLKLIAMLDNGVLSDTVLGSPQIVSFGYPSPSRNMNYCGALNMNYVNSLIFNVTPSASGFVDTVGVIDCYYEILANGDIVRRR